jgi:hypothetical protein
MVSLFMVACRDPGLIERITDEEAGRGGWYWNEQVGSFRPPNGLYSKECGVSSHELINSYLTWKNDIFSHDYRPSQIKGCYRFL